MTDYAEYTRPASSSADTDASILSQIQRAHNTRPPPLVRRRGSISASDPFGSHAAINLNPNRSSSSTLTIVRIDPHASPVNASLSSFPSQESPAGPPYKTRHARRGNSFGSSANQNSQRLSFAFSSFSSHGPAGGRPAASGTQTGPRTNPDTTSTTPPPSPSRHHGRRPSFGAAAPRLTPAELYDIAKQSTSPKFLISSAPSAPSSPVSNDAGVTPAVFTPLPPSVYLPFLDRSSEVSALISSPPTARLFLLLQQTFSKDDTSPPFTPSNLTYDTPAKTDIPSDPLTWTFTHLISWMLLPRSAVHDVLYVQNIRCCILSHSELIWERMKGALGVPPELDVDHFSGEQDWMLHSSGLGGSAIDSDDESFSASEKGLPTFRDATEPHVEVTSARNSSNMTGQSVPSHSSADLPWTEATAASSSPMSHLFVMPQQHNQSDISVSPILVPAALNSLNVAGEGDNLDDITEDEEGEAESQDAALTGTSADTQAHPPLSQPTAAHPPEDDGPRIQGLRLRTAPLAASSHLVGSRPGSAAGSPYSSAPGSRTGSFKSHSRPGSIAHSPMFPVRAGMPSGLHRSMSFGAGTPSYGSSQPSARSSSFGSLSGLALSHEWAGGDSVRGGGPWAQDRTDGDTRGSKEGDGATYDSIGDRAPGRPLFPSNFMRLAPGPTLPDKGGRFPSSHNYGPTFDSARCDYAVTVSSEGSVGE